MSIESASFQVALLPSAGMGHLTPFLRLAAFLVRQNCRVTLITPQPTVSLAESQLISRFTSAFPQVNQLHLHLPPFDPSNTNTTDPFWHQFESVRRSVTHLLAPILSSVSPPLSAFIYDMTLISTVLPVTKTLSLRSYILFTPSAKMFSVYSYFPTIAASINGLDVLRIPGISPIPKSSIPPLYLDPNNLIYGIFSGDSTKLSNLDGVIVNSFQALEEETIEALNGGKVRDDLPPLFPLGPLIPCEEFERVEYSSSVTKWLDDQLEGSVIYICFGSRTPTESDQIKEIGDGLVRSGCRFLWVVREKMVDREEELELEELLGDELMKKLKEKGLVVKTWVDQWAILSHRAVGGFLSHCGWNSLMEAVWNGVRVVAWPQLNDQRLNAEVVEMNGFGIWRRNWGWGEGHVVGGEEIGNAIMEMMSSDTLKINAAKLKEAARKAVAGGGSCELTFHRLVEEWQKNVL